MQGLDFSRVERYFSQTRRAIIPFDDGVPSLPSLHFFRISGQRPSFHRKFYPTLDGSVVQFREIVPDSKTAKSNKLQYSEGLKIEYKC